MPDPCTYDYAIVRVVPRVERGEFVNVGAIVSSDAERYLEARFDVDEARLRRPRSGLDLAAVRTALAAIADRLRAAATGAGPIGAPAAARALPLAGRAAQHDDPDLGRPHRPLRRRSATCSSSCSIAWFGRLARRRRRGRRHERRRRDEHAPRSCRDRRPAVPADRRVDRRARPRRARAHRPRRCAGLARLRRSRRPDGPRCRIAAARRHRAGRIDRHLRRELGALRRDLPRRAARRRRRRAARRLGDAGELSRHARATPARGCSSPTRARPTRWRMQAIVPPP